MNHSSESEGPTYSEEIDTSSNQHVRTPCLKKVSKYKITFSWSNWNKEMLDWTRVYALRSFVGVCLESPVFEIDKDDIRYVCHKFESMDPVNTQSHSKFKKSNRVDHLDKILYLYLPNDGTEENAVLFFSLCQCTACDRKVNLFKAKAMVLNMDIGYNGCKFPKNMTFYPGVTDNFDMKKEAELSEPQNVIYFSKIFKFSKSRWDPMSFERSPKIQISEEPDMELVSSDGKRFYCHKNVLTVRSKVFADKLVQLGNYVRLYVPELSTVVKPFLDHLYYSKFKLKTPLDLETSTGVLNLALQYQLRTMIGEAACKVNRNLNNFTLKDMSVKLRLIKLLENVDKYQSVVVLYYRLSSEPPN